jgi:hypothetical protein
MLTDPLDNRVLATSQRFYAEALRKALLDAGFPEKSVGLSGNYG